MECFGLNKLDDEPIMACLEQFEIRYTLLNLPADNKATWLKAVIGTHGWEVTTSLADGAAYAEIKTAIISVFGTGNVIQEAQRKLSNFS